MIFRQIRATHMHRTMPMTVAVSPSTLGLIITPIHPLNKLQKFPDGIKGYFENEETSTLAWQVNIGFTGFFSSKLVEYNYYTFFWIVTIWLVTSQILYLLLWDLAMTKPRNLDIYPDFFIWKIDWKSWISVSLMRCPDFMHYNRARNNIRTAFLTVFQ